MSDRKTTEEGREHPATIKRPPMVQEWERSIEKIAASLDDISYTLQRLEKNAEQIADNLTYSQDG